MAIRHAIRTYHHPEVGDSESEPEVLERLERGWAVRSVECDRDGDNQFWATLF